MIDLDRLDLYQTVAESSNLVRIDLVRIDLDPIVLVLLVLQQALPREVFVQTFTGLVQADPVPVGRVLFPVQTAVGWIVQRLDLTVTGLVRFVPQYGLARIGLVLVLDLT